MFLEGASGHPSDYKFLLLLLYFVLLPRKARVDAPGVLHQTKGFVSKLEEICLEVTRRTLQRDLNNLIELNLVRLKGAARQSNYELAK
jgi:hypothetical protein